MSDRSLLAARIVSSIAATCISLACGTNYVYSAWGPQFAEKLKLSSTQQNMIGLSANLGMYSLGIPIGMLVDAKGPRIATMVGAVLLAAGYFPLHQAYDRGFESMPVPVLCMFSYFTGVGGCAAFAAAVKTSALNWPHHRGTATGFPLAAFGLSAFFFSMFKQFVMPGSTGDFLLLLACGTFGLVFISFFFLRVLPHSHYSAVPSGNRLHKTKSEDSKHRREHALEPEPGMSKFVVAHLDQGDALNQHHVEVEAPDEDLNPTSETDETSSLMSKSSSSIHGDGVLSGEIFVKDHAHRVDIRGFKMLSMLEFWQLFSLMGILTGIGLMTINNIGNDATALWRHYDDSVTDDFVQKRQAMHVSILSVCSFIGRLFSGVGSDFLHKVLRASRLWCLTLAAVVFLVVQVAALNITNPHQLVIVSSFTGLAYGFLFGCFPSLIAEAFGIHGMSTNWGFMTLSPVISGNVFNLFYGMVYDHHSIVNKDGERVCTEGLACYRSAYLVTVSACVLGLAISLWSIRYTHIARIQEEKMRELEEREE